MTKQQEAAINRACAHECVRQELIEALEAARVYVQCAYECAFPDEQKNEQVLANIDAVLAKAKEQ